MSENNTLPPVPAQPSETERNETNPTEINSALTLENEDLAAISLFLEVQERPGQIDAGEALRIESMADACAISREDKTMEIKPGEPDDVWYRMTYDHENRKMTLGICTSDAETREKLDSYAGRLKRVGWKYNQNNQREDIFEREWSVDPATEDIDAQIEDLVDVLLDVGGWLRHPHP